MRLTGEAMAGLGEEGHTSGLLKAPAWLSALGKSAVDRWNGAHGAIKLLVLAVLAFSAWVLSALVDKPIDDFWQNSKEQPFVAVILSQGEKDFTIPLELRNGIQFKGKMFSGPRGENVAIKYFSPARNPSETRVATRQNCLIHPNCIAIVGGADSTTTEAMLTEIVEYDYTDGETRPALIAPIATATDISRIAGRNNFHSLLRLVPDNRDQARRITSFIAKRSPSQRVMIIQDNKNPTYAKDLTDNLKREIKENAGDPQVLQYLDTSTLQGAQMRGLENIDAIVFVGTVENGLNIIADLKRYRIKTLTLFSDGNTTREAVASAEDAPGDVFFLTPVFLKNDLNAAEQSEPGYTLIGRDTFTIMSNILGAVDRIDRASVAKYISERKFEIALANGDAGPYGFGQDGENSEMSFQILSARDGKLDRQTGY